MNVFHFVFVQAHVDFALGIGVFSVVAIVLYIPLVTQLSKHGSLSFDRQSFCRALTCSSCMLYYAVVRKVTMQYITYKTSYWSGGTMLDRCGSVQASPPNVVCDPSHTVHDECVTNNAGMSQENFPSHSCYSVSMLFHNTCINAVSISFEHSPGSCKIKLQAGD